MWTKLKKLIIMSLVVVCLGGVIGSITWVFLYIMNIGIDFFWYLIPEKLNFSFYPIIICTIGGLIIGFFELKFGQYPEELSEMMAEIKKGEKKPYNNIPVLLAAALLPLLFGGCIGPEAGLSGVIIALCFWFSDKFKFAFSEIEDLAEIGMSATIGIIFASPLFAFANQIEDSNSDKRIPKNTKVLMYFIAILGGFGLFLLLSHFFGGSSGLSHFPEIGKIETLEWLAAIPLAIIGGFFGVLYFIFKKFVKTAAYPLRKKIVLRAGIAGVILGISGMLLPYTLFSGEHQMAELMVAWKEIGFVFLLLTAIVKLFIGNVCVEMGWRGGNIFPVIFSGVALGYACAWFLPIDPIFCVAVVTAALTASIMRKPLAVVLLLLICFPVNGIIPMVIGAAIGGAIPLPNFLGKYQPE